MCIRDRDEDENEDEGGDEVEVECKCVKMRDSCRSTVWEERFEGVLSAYICLFVSDLPCSVAGTAAAAAVTVYLDFDGFLHGDDGAAAAAADAGDGNGDRGESTSSSTTAAKTRLHCPVPSGLSRCRLLKGFAGW